jgi:serine/threonine protein kinase
MAAAAVATIPEALLLSPADDTINFSLAALHHTCAPARQRFMDETAEPARRVHSSGNVHAQPGKLKPPPLVLNERFQILDLVATGGTSYVHRARDLLADQHWHDGSDVAIKVTRRLPHMRALGPEFNARIIAYETQVARRLSHPGILRIFDFHRDGNAHFLTMEYVPGEPLSERIRRAPRRRLPYEAVLTVLTEVSDALTAAHRAGIVHSDLKPSNILLADNGGIKLIDFANARPTNSLSRRRRALDSGYVGYSPAYASLETLEDLPATPSDDVYSLGCILYEMLAGTHPFERKSAIEVQRHGMRPARPAGVNIIQWWVLRKALNTNGRDRFQDANKFATAFRLSRNGPRHALSAMALAVAGLFAAAFFPSPQIPANAAPAYQKELAVVPNQIAAIMPGQAKLPRDRLAVLTDMKSVLPAPSAK